MAQDFLVFNNINAANGYCNAAYNHLMATTHAGASQAYKDGTTAWAVPHPRESDGKYVVPKFNGVGNSGGKTEPHDRLWWKKSDSET